MEKKVLLKNYFCIYLFLAVLGLRYSAQAFSLVAEGGGYSLVPVHGLPTAVPSLTAGHRLVPGLSICGSLPLEHRRNSCGTQAWLLHGSS